MSEHRPTGYVYADAAPTGAHSYLFPALASILDDMTWAEVGARRIFDLGCGNGATGQFLFQKGYDITGVDPSDEGIAQGWAAYSNLKLHAGSAYDDLAAMYGQFPVVVSLEVVEHVYYPRKYARCLADLLEPGGAAIVSTPYHGYWKNLMLALTGKLDAHFTVLWDHGHIKFWSVRTLTQLFDEVGLKVERFVRVGRIPPLAKSMIAIVRKPR